MTTVTRASAASGAWTHAPLSLPSTATSVSGRHLSVGGFHATLQNGGILGGGFTRRPDRHRRPATSIGHGGRPLVLAHRGSPALNRPENTVVAVIAALEGGANGVEVDVRASSDGQLLCSHDPDLSRLAGVTLSVARYSAASLRRVRLPGGHTVALLDELLSAVASRGRYRVVVEAKECADRSAAEDLAAALRRVLGAYAAVLDLTVSSFDPTLLAAIRASLTDIDVRTALLGSTFAPGADLLRDAVTEGHDEIHPYFRTLLREPGVADAARTLGIGVTCWTVNRPRDVELVAALGVDAVITDDVPGARAALRSERDSLDAMPARPSLA